MDTTAFEQYLSHVRTETERRSVRIHELRERIDALRVELWERMDRQSAGAGAPCTPIDSAPRPGDRR